MMNVKPQVFSTNKEKNQSNGKNYNDNASEFRFEKCLRSGTDN